MLQLMNCLFPSESGEAYIPSKPAKYVLKARILTDSKPYFVYSVYLYCGKGTEGLTLTPEWRIVRLCKPIVNSNRNTTCDNWYIYIQLVEELRNMRLALVGTMIKNIKEIPNEFLSLNKRTSGFTNNTTLLSHVPKILKTVLQISTMHHSLEVGHETNILEIIAHYKKTEGGVDTVDEKCSKYCSSQRTRYWRMGLFLHLLDMSSLNAFIVTNYYETDITFMKAQGKQLTQYALQERFVNARLPRELRMAVERVLRTDMKPN
ncbi:hypothetical protein PR048_005943 [Dryococelus australis]|uniref:PiggyBac transposable element-derived protein domain-containing protein n=1 Tax=Dryococelus australis TaxID=614101 RepID=A0ABQ9I9M0_9NEOP|nr:hypothetical protein PR048_005943 [Dryococelus australis]